MGPAVERLEEEDWAMMVVGSHNEVAESVPVGVILYTGGGVEVEVEKAGGGV